MCLIALAWRAQPSHTLVVAANRDEFHGRPAAPAAFWADAPAILAGRDLQAKGTWMGVSRNGRFAAVTNYRGATEPSAPHSRGALVADFLRNPISPAEHVGNVAEKAKSYSGFNLLLADERELWWLSNRDGKPRRLEPGIYGLGNLLLDDPAVEPAKVRFASALQAGPAVESLFKALEPAKIVNPQYGTRCSTVLLSGAGGRIRYAERGFSPEGAEGETVSYEYSVSEGKS